MLPANKTVLGNTTFTFLAALLLLSATQAQASRPNIVFFLVDDMGWKDLGCFGSSFYETPNIDKLAASGMRFTNAYAACPVCSPTRASILAGKYPARMNTTDYFGGQRKKKLLPAPYIQRMPHEEVTLAETLKEARYRTGFFGKWHLGRAPFTPESQGFDVNKGGFWRGHPPKGYFAPYGNPKLADGPKGEYLTERLTTEALTFLDESKDGPFLLYFSFYTVHTPLQAKKDRTAYYKKKRDALPEPQGPRWLPEGKRKCRQVQDHARYAAMVEAVDVSVGHVLAKIDALGLSGDTIVVLFSDNGGLSTSEGHPTSNVPLRAGKGWLYEGGIREPMIVRWPGRTKPGSVTDVPVISTDFYPTLLQMAGLAPRPRQHLDGVSLVPLLTGSGTIAPRTLYWHYPHYGNQGATPACAIRDGRYKLIEWLEDGRTEVFDLEADIGERKNLVQSQPVLAKHLRDKLVAWRAAVDAQMPSPNPDWKEK